ncbi:MAG: phosphoenolpyruvate carboxykinase (GTP) [Candidatus Omnitrophica bacterium]|nr:phosphoenolpyruvate carboxykinase (GTP) [Candidatus Omnitrophota bacterium]
MPTAIKVPTTNAALHQWVQECAALCQPEAILWCNGSEAERAALMKEACARGVFIELNQTVLPGGYLHRSHPNDTARTEHCTFICTPAKNEAGPTNNWMAPEEAYRTLRQCFEGCMKGRAMYVVPFLMGHPGSSLAKVGVQLTDSIYVALSMRIMTRMGEVALRELGNRPTFTQCLHSVGALDPNRRYICHFPQDNTIWSYGSGYGGNALLGKKCLALRIGSALAQREGWMAEHMLIAGLQAPDGQITYFTGAFPSACGKTNLAMLRPPRRFAEAGWRVTTVGDDIAWMRADAQGRLRAVNPEFGYFGVIPGTSTKTNPSAVEILSHDALFTNAALLPDGTPWWEGKDGPVPPQCIDWMGKPWTPSSGTKAAHPNSRFTAPQAHNPQLDPRWNDPQGVPISAIIFGGRRSTTVPLITEAFNWTHGVYLAATLGSETTAAATGAVGVVRRDPMAMLPFCGYHMGRYFTHWLSMERRLSAAPRIFFVNWFRTDNTGKFLWPGFGENIRLLQWIAARCQGRAGAIETPLGLMPKPEEIDLDGSGVTRAQFEQAQAIDRDTWKTEIASQSEFFATLSTDVPSALLRERDALLRRL